MNEAERWPSNQGLVPAWPWASNIMLRLQVQRASINACAR